jgi:hypothetical protein
MSSAQLAHYYAPDALAKVPANTPAFRSGTCMLTTVGDYLKYVPTAEEIDSFQEFLDEVSIRLLRHQVESRENQSQNVRDTSLDVTRPALGG